MAMTISVCDGRMMQHVADFRVEATDHATCDQPLLGDVAGR
jgi:hypothetical protein